MNWPNKIYMIENNMVTDLTFIQEYKLGYAFYLDNFSCKPKRIYKNEEFYINLKVVLKILIKKNEKTIEFFKDLLKEEEEKICRR